MLLDAASKIISMVINGRLQRLLKEVGIEEQNGFVGGQPDPLPLRDAGRA